MSFSRLAANTAPNGTNLDYPVNGGSSTVTVTDNWWGTNAPAGTIQGTVTFDPFIVLTHTASPQEINIDGSSTLTGNMSTDSEGNAITASDLTQIVGLPITFNGAVLGTIPQTQPETLNASAEATATFTAGGTGGLGTANATVDQAVVPVNSNLIASATETGTTVTITTVGAHGFTTGEFVSISGVGTGYNGSFFPITATPTATTFTYTASTSGLATISNQGTANAGIEVLQPPSMTKSFNPTTVAENKASTVTFSITNGNAVAIEASFTDLLPTNLVVATTPNVVNGCGGTVTATAGAGTISFSNDSLPAVPCTIQVNVQSAVDNSVTIDSTDAGDGNTATATLTVINPATSTTVTSSTNPSVFGQSVTFTATVSPVEAGAGTPTGTVTFLDSGSPIGTGTLIGGVATFTTSALAVGSHTITASYGGGGNFNGSIGSLTGNPQVVNRANTATGVTSSVNPSVFGQSVTFTATVSPVAPGTGTPTGTVTFLDGGAQIGTGTLSGGTASFTTSALAVGRHTITASYSLTGNFNGSTGSLTGNPQIVNKAGTSTTVTSSQNPSTLSQAVTFTATISAAAPGAGTPTETVTFLDGGRTIGIGTLSGGVASFTTSTLSAGNHTITASYGGDGNFNASTGSLTQVVNGTTTTTAVTASAGTITLGDTVTLTATVTASTGTPSGQVTFLDGNTPLGSGPLNAATPDQATLTTALLSAAGSPHSITAIYQGAGAFEASTSSAISETVNERSSSTGVSLNPASVDVGQASTATVTLTDSGSAPPGTADSFTATGAPATGRTGFTSTLFADGLVLIAGGTDANNNVLQSAEIYSVSGATFSATGNLNTARAGAVAVLLPTGKVLIAGGSSNGTANGALNTAELFDPNSGTFAVAGSGSSNAMTAARFGATATLLDNGQVLIAAGQNSGGVLNSAEVYNPATDTFTATGNLNTARTGASATLLATDEVLIAGGSSDGTANGALNSAELFDPAGNGGAGTFTSVAGANPTLAAGRWQPEAALLLSGKVLLAGGQNSGGALTSADLYDPVANSFTASSQQMAQARANGSAVALPNGMVLLAGGTISQAVDLYDADSDRFDTTGSLQQSDVGLVSTLLNNGDVLVVGLTTAAPPASDAELYAPSFNPLGTVGLTSSEVTDSITGACTLTPSTTIASTCTSTVTPANVATSPHTITGTYSADAVHAGSSNTASLTVNKDDTTTSVTSSANPSVSGQSVTFTATVSAVAPGAGTPTGTVTFLDGGSPIGTGTLGGGVASFSTSALAVGSHTITTSYLGDSDFNGSTGSLTGNPQVVNSTLTATQAIASTTLTQNHAATPFTPVVGSGGTAPLSYGVSPSLPTGLSMSSSSGAISGTPTVAHAASNFTVTVTDANGAAAVAGFSLTVNPAVTATQAIASTTLTLNHTATPFTPVVGSGGTAPLSYSVSPSLPTGLSMSSSSGAISGTPTVAHAASNFTVTVTDANNATASASFSLTVNNNVPTVTAVVPNSGPPAGGTSVTVIGTNFTGASAVKFGGNAASFTVASATSITATSPAGSGTVDVTVTTPAGTSATTSTDRFTYTSATSSYEQQGTKLVGSGNLSGAEQGHAVALSADGNTALVAGFNDNGGAGAVWVFSRGDDGWTQVGGKLVGTGAIGAAQQGRSVALSADASTLLIGGTADNGNIGAVWVFTQSGGVWSQQGAKLTASDEGGAGLFGSSVALSANGNLAIIGGPGDAAGNGAAWIFGRNGNSWAQQGFKLTPSDESGAGAFGDAVALSSSGTSAVIGGAADNAGNGAAWSFSQSGGLWLQGGPKLVGIGNVGPAQQGDAVALSADGNTALVGGFADSGNTGAGWIFTQSGGPWTQSGSKLVGTGVTGAAEEGLSVALSADASTAALGGATDNTLNGAVWVFAQGNGVWTQKGSKLVGSGAIGAAQQGTAAALSSNGNTLIEGGPFDNAGIGAAWVFVAPTITATHDFNGDGKSDILWRDTSDDLGLWLMNGAQILQSATYPGVPANWSVVGQRSFTGNADADLLWRDTAGDVGMWIMNGTQIQSTTTLGNVPTTWSVVGTGDFNADGDADILWLDNQNNLGIWLMNGTQILQAGVVGQLPPNWIVVGSDMKGDIFLRNTASGEVGMWVMNGTTVAQAVDFGAVPLTWTVAGIGDFDGNGSTDLLWRDASGNVGIWLMNGTQILSAIVLGNVPLNWTIAETGDYNGDGKTDILWIDNKGNVGVWFMSGTTISSITIYGNVGTAWTVQSLNAD